MEFIEIQEEIKELYRQQGEMDPQFQLADMIDLDILICELEDMI